MSNKFRQTEGYSVIVRWMQSKGNIPFCFQEKTWERYANGYSGMVIAPTGFGKTFSVFLAVLSDFMNHTDRYQSGLKLLWITPLRSLAKDLGRAMQAAIYEIGIYWNLCVGNGDSEVKEKQLQIKSSQHE